MNFQNLNSHGTRTADCEEQKKLVKKRVETIESFQRVENFFYKVAKLYSERIVFQNTCRKFFKDEFNYLMNEKKFKVICTEMKGTSMVNDGNFQWAEVLLQFQERLNNDKSKLEILSEKVRNVRNSYFGNCL